ncbi:MAG: hypothetical protein IJ041_07205 [Clostridia bacterium]|nr:hypothetical protein [Clostridia bacterium]
MKKRLIALATIFCLLLAAVPAGASSYLPQSAQPGGPVPGYMTFTAMASSEYKLKYNKEYQVNASMAVDGNLITAWNEGAPGPGVGEWIMLMPTDGNTYTYQGFQIANGFQYEHYPKGDRWTMNNRVKYLQVTDDCGNFIGNFLIQDIRDGYQVFFFSQPVTTRFLKFQIMSVWLGNTHPEACISELKPF